MGREAGGREQRSQGIDILLLVADGVSLRVGRAGTDAPGVVVGDVGREAAHLRRPPRRLIQVAEHARRRTDVGSPAEPAGVSGIEIHGHVGEVELLDGVGGAFLVGGGRAGALGHVQVGDEVREGIRLCQFSHEYLSRAFRSLQACGYAPITRMTFTSEYETRRAVMASMYFL